MKELPVETIMLTVADYFHLTIEEMKSYRKFTEYVRARQIAMYFCQGYTVLSDREIGTYFRENDKAKDHATVFYSTKKVGELRDIYPKYKTYITEIEALLKIQLENYTEDLKADESEVYMENDYYELEYFNLKTES